jgi:FkbM family methyltransferase
MAKRAVRLLAERVVFQNRRVPLRVRSGLSRDLWIQARLPEEANYWHGTRESFTEQVIESSVREGEVVFDVGAHIGAITFGTARLVGMKGRVVAFEADPENVASLRKSCVLNHFADRIQVVHAAVWSRSSNHRLDFRRGGRRLSHGGVIADTCRPVRAEGATISVPSTTLDRFCSEHEIAPNLVKIDVEGGEYEVLRGGEDLFSRHRPRIVVEVHHADALTDIENWIGRFRYGAQWSTPRQGFPRILFAWPAEFPPDL